MIDRAGCICKLKNVMELVSFQCFSQSLVCFSTFFLTFLFYFIWHNPSRHWLATPASHQGGIQTPSISHSNSCIWQVPVRHPNAFQLSVKTPPCLLFIADPRPTSSLPVPTKTAPPLLSTLLLGVVFIPDALVDSKPLKWVLFSVPQVCVVVPKMCFSNGWCTHLLQVCFVFLSLFCSVFGQVFRNGIIFLYLTNDLPSFVICVAQCIQSLTK